MEFYSEYGLTAVSEKQAKFGSDMALKKKRLLQELLSWSTEFNQKMQEKYKDDDTFDDFLDDEPEEDEEKPTEFYNRIHSEIESYVAKIMEGTNASDWIELHVYDRSNAYKFFIENSIDEINAHKRSIGVIYDKISRKHHIITATRGHLHNQKRALSLD